MGGRWLRQGLVGALAGLVWAPVALAAPLAAGPPDDRQDLPLISTIVSPDWARRPSGEELELFYPPLAQLLGLTGAATMQCLVAVDGALYGCKILSESPVGLGFGDATLLAATLFRMTPMTVDGKPKAGASVTVPLRWNADDGGAPAPASDVEDGSTRVSPEALALGRRIVLASDFKARLLDAIVAFDRNTVEQAVKKGASPPPPAALQRVTAMLRAAYGAKLDSLIDRRARTYATGMTSAALMESARFFESPAGRAWTAQQGRKGLLLESSDLTNSVILPAKAAAAASFCREMSCKLSSVPARGSE